MEIFNGFYYPRRSKFRGALNGLCAFLLFSFFFYQEDIFTSPFLRQSSPNFQKWDFRGGLLRGETNRVEIIRRKLGEVSLDSSNLTEFWSAQNYVGAKESAGCTGLNEHKGYTSQCEFLTANPQCKSGGLLDYIQFFSCGCENFIFLGYLALGIWLVALFYLLGNTASDYFCCFLEKLSNLWKLPPTVAGVTLLPLGNGAPDVFASIASFTGSNDGDVGLSIVVGTISLCVAEQRVQIDKRCFIRDEVCFSQQTGDEESLYGNLLLSDSGNEVPHLQTKLPHWMWASNVAIYANESVNPTLQESPKPLWGWNDDETREGQSWFLCSKICSLLELPLVLPRRLTIPVIEDDRWLKGFAVSSASMAPMLLAFLWNTQDDIYLQSGEIAYPVGEIVGCILGVLAFICTRSDRPPQKYLLPWLLGGFFMSIIWFYIVANELVALLVSLGVIFGINPSLLGLTVLAWGNSTGDLMSNVALAMNGGDGVQIAMSGCFAGPMFNTLAGLGISMLLGAWSKRPASYVVPRDTSLYSTLGFLILGLFWSLIVILKNDMRPSKLLGIGLLTIYLVFLSFRVSMAMGDGSLDGSN